MTQHEEAIELIQETIEAAKKDLPENEEWVLPDRIFLLNTTFIKSINNILENIRSQQDSIPLDSLELFIQESMDHKWTKNVFIDVEDLPLSEKTFTTLKTLALFSIKGFLNKFNAMLKEMPTDIRSNFENDLQQHISIVMDQLLKGINISFRTVRFYKAFKRIQSKQYELMKSFLPVDESEKIELIKSQNENMMTAMEKIFQIIASHVNSSSKLLEIMQCFGSILMEDTVLATIENNPLDLSSIVFDNCMMQTISTTNSYEEFKINFLETLSKLQEKDNKTAVQQVLNSAVSDEIKHHLLKPEHIAILKTQQTHPIGFSYYLNIQEHHSVKDFIDHSTFIKLLTTHEQFVKDTMNAEPEKEAIPTHLLSFFGEKLPSNRASLDNCQPPSLLKLAANATVCFFREERKRAEAEVKPLELNVSNLRITP